MLSEQAYQERRWGWLPSLRIALQDKPIPSDGHFTSIDDSEPQRIGRLIQIAALARAYPAEVGDVAQRVGRGSMHHDIVRLGEALRAAGEHFTSLAREVDELHRVVEGEGLGEDSVR